MNREKRRNAESNSDVMERKIVIIVSLLLCFVSLGYYSSCISWYHLQRTTASNIGERYLLHYDKLYRWLKYDERFLYNYSLVAFQNGEMDLFESVANDLLTISYDYDNLLLVSEKLMAEGKHDETVTVFQEMSYMCPSKFIPQYRLFELALSRSDYAEAKRIADVVINKPVKVESNSIKIIKEKCKSFSINH